MNTTTDLDSREINHGRQATVVAVQFLIGFCRAAEQPELIWEPLGLAPALSGDGTFGGSRLT